MLKEFVDRIVALADAARGPKVVRPDGEPAHVYYLEHDGELRPREVSPQPRNHRASSLAAVVQFAKDCPECRVWYSREAVVCLLNDEIRRDRVTLALALSPQLRRLLALAATPAWHAHRDFVRLLRIDLGVCLGPAGSLLEAVRLLRFRQAKDSASEVAHGKASLGRRLESELTGAEAVPEAVVLDVPLFANLLLPPQRVRCAIDIDTQAETLQLLPLPGELEWALQAGEKIVGERLAQDLPGCSVCYGNP